MSDDKLDHVLDAWAEGEASSAPEMRPTEEMVRLVRARASAHRRFSLAMPRWATVSRAAVALVVLAIASTLLLRTLPAPQLAYVRQREGFAAEKGVVVRGGA
jgi:hypothetical protein